MLIKTIFPEISGEFEVILNVIAKQHHLDDENIALITTFIQPNPLLRNQFLIQVTKFPARITTITRN